MTMLTPNQVSERKRKRTILFVSDECPIWAQIRGLERKANISIAALRMDRSKGKRSKKRPSIPSEKSLLLNISEETIRQWRRGEVATAGPAGRNALSCLLEGLQALITWLSNEGSQLEASAPPAEEALSPNAREECIAAARSLRDRIVTFSAHYDSEEQEAPVYKSGLALGMSIDMVQKAIDIAYYSSKPLLLKPYIADEELGRESLGSLEGLYYAWLRRTSNGTTRWLRCTLHVRYLVKMGEQFIIRAKLNLPNLAQKTNTPDSEAVQRERDYHEYDGFVDPKPHRVFWSFEKRSSARHDYVHMITGHRGSWSVSTSDAPNYEFHGLAGQYLTCHQDPLQSIKTGTVLLEMVPEEALKRATTAKKEQEQHADLFRASPQIGIMWSKPKVLERPPESAHGEKAAAERAQFDLYEALARALDTATEPPL